MRIEGGFTIIELLLSLAIIGVLLMVSPLAFGSFQEKHQIDFALQTSLQALRSAQIQSQAVENDQRWGVFFQNGSVTVFQGSSYATRNSAFDQEQQIASQVIVGGLLEVVYDKLTGQPQTTGTITFETTHENRFITLLEKGAVQ